MRSAYLTRCLLALALFSTVGSAQIEELREATGLPLAIDQSVIYGQVVLDGVPRGTKRPTVDVMLVTRNSMTSRTSADRSGYYYFRDTPSGTGTIIVEVDGVEYGRQHIFGSSGKQQRYDFRIMLRPPTSAPPPGTVSAKYAYERSKENARLIDKAARAAERKNIDKTISYLKQIIENDPKDFGAWSLLGTAYFSLSNYPDAESAYRTALELQPGFAHVMVNLGKLYMFQKQIDKAVPILERATRAEPEFPLAFGMLGEAYLHAQKGSLAVPALNEALRLAPVEMAKCHLLLAWLFDASGEKKLAAAEYKAFLAKVSDHPDRAKFKKYISDNPQ
jgi:Tfp pilus assembly protein PilF